ncbi:MAG: hypothetical protein QJR03_05555 [Sphaerobacter sp.]|nr:hypothetical protein [Sphaerobacter sp.]
MAAIPSARRWTTLDGDTVTAPTDRAALGRAVVRALAYGDVFDYPLTAAEVHRYLVGVAASPAAVQALLSDPAARPAPITFHDGYYLLRGREATVATRRQRAARAARLWPRAVRYGRAIARLPFVRMVAVTGELAIDSVDQGGDLDYLIVTAPGRLWLCRALVIGIVRLARACGDVVCPNYLLSERALALTDRNLYTAHELTQMVPLSGLAVYERMRRLNGWTARFLPNAAGPPSLMTPDLADDGGLRALTELPLRTPVGERLERWERERKIRRLSQASGPGAEAEFTADWCKGHIDGHGRRTLAAYAARLRALGVFDPDGGWMS